MPEISKNPWRGKGLRLGMPDPLSSAAGVADLLLACPAHAVTPLLTLPGLATAVGVSQVWAKDERDRMGLGSFKALGAAYVIARDASRSGTEPAKSLHGRVYATASAGNHGLSVAAGARVFGARAIVYLAETVPETFAERLRQAGADVVRAGADYAASMAAAAEAAAREGWTLLSDSSWAGYTEPALRVMEGYTQLAAEILAQMNEVPSHILLQAGVGGLAAAVTAHLRPAWGSMPKIIIVEPDAAPALFDSIRAGHPVTAPGPVSSMGRLDCKTPSLIALQALARDADCFTTITEAEAAAGIAALARHGIETTPSGGAGLAALIAGLKLPPDARVLAILSEGAPDA